MPITILSTKEFMEMPKQNEPKLTLNQFLVKYFITDENDCNGWKFKGKFTKEIDVATEWFNELNK